MPLFTFGTKQFVILPHGAYTNFTKFGVRFRYFLTLFSYHFYLEFRKSFTIVLESSLQYFFHQRTVVSLNFETEIISAQIDKWKMLRKAA